MRKHNFGAGPGVLPEAAIKKTQESLFDFNNSGMGVMEISHRSKDCDAVLQKAKSLVKELLHVPDTHEVLFLQGGASTQFAMVPMNFLKKKAAYIDQGAWSNKAIKEAKLFGEVEVIASSKDKNYSYQPKGYTIPADCDYLHICSNETIHGTQVKNFPASPIPVICDMSSDIFSRPVDVSKFDMIYAGAQKNMGPSGVTLVIIKKDIVGKSEKVMPTMLNYKTHLENDSLLIIDEPEVSLHPNWQIDYLEILKPIIDKYTGVNVIISTHSHLLVSSLKNDESRITSIVRNPENGSILIEELDYETYG